MMAYSLSGAYASSNVAGDTTGNKCYCPFARIRFLRGLGQLFERALWLSRILGRSAFH